MTSKEIIKRIKEKVRFQQSDNEKNSHYALLGHYLVRISDNPITDTPQMDRFLNKHDGENIKIVSFVFQSELGFPEAQECKYYGTTETYFNSEKFTEEYLDKILELFKEMGAGKTFDWTFNGVVGTGAHECFRIIEKNSI